jgi:hypothetical protein
MNLFHQDRGRVSSSNGICEGLTLRFDPRAFGPNVHEGWCVLMRARCDQSLSYDYPRK